MPYIIITTGGQEVDRLKLVDPILIGRSAECDLPVRDVLMSRRHCRLEPAGRGWRMVDLQSKNGIHLDGERIQRRVLADGDQLRLGRTTIQFLTGAFEPPPQGRSTKPIRPADPFEALSGTISGMVLDQEAAGPSSHPVSPLSWHDPSEESVAWFVDRPTVAMMGTELLAQPTRSQRPAPFPIPRPIMRQCGLRRPVMRQVDDVSLQVMPQQLAELPLPAAIHVAAPTAVEWGLVLSLAAGSAVTVLLFMSDWLRMMLS